MLNFILLRQTSFNSTSKMTHHWHKVCDQGRKYRIDIDIDIDSLYDPGCSSRILDPDADILPSRIQGSKWYPIPDPDPQHCIPIYPPLPPPTTAVARQRIMCALVQYKTFTGSFTQCYGSVTFWYGSGCADPFL